jgi:hypothetical protein
VHRAFGCGCASVESGEVLVDDRSVDAAGMGVLADLVGGGEVLVRIVAAEGGGCGSGTFVAGSPTEG